MIAVEGYVAFMHVMTRWPEWYVVRWDKSWWVVLQENGEEYAVAECDYLSEAKQIVRGLRMLRDAEVDA